jgi:hypothetical protein
MTRLLPSAAIFLTLVSAALAQTPAPAPAPDAKALLRGSLRREQDGWIFVHLQGPPSTLGFQHGWLLAPEIADLLAVVKTLDCKRTQRDWSFFRTTAEKVLWPGIDAEYQAEIDGIVAGLHGRNVDADRWDVVALNALEEVPDYYLPWLEKQQGRPASTHSPGNCSAFIATGKATADGRIVMGHNAWTNYVVGSRWNVVFDLQPERGHRMLMDGLPGVIVSDDDFAINDGGLLVTETTITQFEGFDPKGRPEFARARKAMQYGATIDDFVAIMLDGNNGGYANDWLLGDNHKNEIARFELGLRHHRLERTQDGVYFGANFPCDPQLTAAETKFDGADKTSSPNARRLRWEQLVAEWHGRIDVEAGKRFETDCVDATTGKAGANEHTLFGAVEVSAAGTPQWDWGPWYPGGTVQSKVTSGALADKLEFWAAFGHPVGPEFKVDAFVKAHPEYAWMQPLLKDLTAHPWSRFGPHGS